MWVLWSTQPHRQDPDSCLQTHSKAVPIDKGQSRVPHASSNLGCAEVEKWGEWGGRAINVGINRAESYPPLQIGW